MCLFFFAEKGKNKIQKSLTKKNKNKMSTTPKYEVVVHMPDAVADKIVTSNGIKESVTDNSFYGTPSPTVLAFGIDIQAATDAEAGTKTNPPTVTVNNRDGKVNKMLDDIESYRLDCQKLVNVAPDETTANAIAQSFNMELKTHTSRGPRQDEILEGPLPNSVLYRMKGTGPHQIQLSWDNGVTTEGLDPSGKGEKVINGLDVNKNFWLRNRQILPKDQYSDWTDWKKFAIHK